MKTVLITGSTSGVGLHLVGVFLQRGYRVAATARNLEKLNNVAKENHWPTENLLLLTLDVISSEQWGNAITRILSEWGELDLFLNVAGYLLPGYVHETPEQEIHNHMDTNVKGLMIGARLVAQQMVKQGGGHMINIASTASLLPVAGLALYSASKFAVRAFSLAMAEELKPLGVSVSVFCPDAIDTPMLSKQEDYPEAALAFSGGAVLSLHDIEKAIFTVVIPNRPFEYGLPRGRAILAKLSNLMPGKFGWIEQRLREKGKLAQKNRLKP